MSFVDLPNNLWRDIIFRELSKNDLACMMATSRSIYKMIKEDKYLKNRMTVYSIAELWGGDICLSIFSENDEDMASECVYCLLIEWVDRGIQDFEKFAYELKQEYPNLKELKFSQNYSFNTDISGNHIDNMVPQFLKFLKDMNLCYFSLDDLQSISLSDLKVTDVLNVMPNYANYKIGLNLYDIPDENFLNDTLNWAYIDQFLGVEGKKLRFCNIVK